MRDVMKYSAEAFAERMLLEGDLQGNRIVLQLLQQRAELLEALKLLHRNFRSQHSTLLILGAPDFVYMDKVADRAITKSEAA